GASSARGGCTSRRTEESPPGRLRCGRAGASSMCELFAMSGSEPANVTFSLGVFGERGGRLGPHRDGWGLAFAGRRDFRIVKEAEPAASSACMRFVEPNEIRSTIVISHLRLATGHRIVSYENTHPF